MSKKRGRDKSVQLSVFPSGPDHMVVADNDAPTGIENYRNDEPEGQFLKEVYERMQQKRKKK